MNFEKLWLISCKKSKLTMITCEMLSVFGFFNDSSMWYLSPFGVCFILAFSTEQSKLKISDHFLEIVGTWGTRTHAWDLLSNVALFEEVFSSARHNGMVWVVLAVYCARAPFGPF